MARRSIRWRCLGWRCLGWRCLAAAWALSLTVVGSARGAAPATASAEPATAALAVMEAFLRAFNDRDESAWADTLLFPHVRMASGQVLVYPDRAAFLEAMDLDRFAEETGWDHSTWDDMTVVQTSPDKVHITVTFSRYDRRGAKLAAFDSFYVVENAGGRWGVRARSSFAP